GHNLRIFSVSKQWIERLQLLSKKSERIFPVPMIGMYNNFWWQRKRVAKNFNNPRLLKITFTTFRH
ncbi:MAG: site-specific integrase, partial [Candidatus Bathyarchaeia archaeon]